MTSLVAGLGQQLRLAGLSIWVMAYSAGWRGAAGGRDGQSSAKNAAVVGSVFTGYREKVIDTVLGPVTLRRAWYHCARYEHGLAPGR